MRVARLCGCENDEGEEEEDDEVEIDTSSGDEIPERKRRSIPDAD